MSEDKVIAEAAKPSFVTPEPAKEADEGKKAKKEKTVNVVIVRGYFPFGVDEDGNPKAKIKAGETASLPEDEAKRAVKLGIATYRE